MKKITLFIVALTVSSSLLTAQTSSILRSVLPLTPQQKIAAFNKNLRRAHIQTRSADSVRLTGISYYTYNTTNYDITDSVQFTYTGSNGGTLYQFEGGSFTGMAFTTQNSNVYVGGDFSDDTLVTQTFNSNDLIDSSKTQVWSNFHSQWENNSLSTFTYDNNHNLALGFDFSWDSTKLEWAPADGARFAYNNNILDTLTLLIYSSGAFENYFREIEHYTSANLPDTEIVQLYSNTWQNEQRDIYLYDASDNDTSYIIQEFNAGWKNYDKEVLNYTGSKYPYEAFIFSWATTSWDSSEKLLYYYDGNANDTALVEQIFSNGEWLGYYDVLYQYNSYDQPTSFTILSYVNTSYVPEARQLYYYQTYATGIDQLPVNNNQISLYPNPTTGLVTINSTQKINNITVTNLLGQIILAQSTPLSTMGGLVSDKIGGPGVRQIDLSPYPNGMYFVTVTTDAGLVTDKISINR